MTAPPATVRPTRQEAAINVAGNVDGSIVQGDGNVVVHTNYGTILNEAVTPKRERRPVAPGPRPPVPFLARSEELASLRAIVEQRAAATVSGDRGAGRTALMRAAAIAQNALPDGVLRIDAVDVDGTALTIDELAQRLHDAAWDCVPTVKVDPAAARTELGQIQALAMFDDVALSGRDIERLADLLPSGAVLIATQRAAIDSDLPDVVVRGLQRADAIALLAARVGSTPGSTPDAQADLDAICQLLADWPEAIVVAGGAIKRRGLTWSAARGELLAAATRPAEASAAAIEQAYALAYPALDDNARLVLMAAALLPSLTTDPEVLRAVLGAPQWFDGAVEQLKALGLLTLNSPRFRIPDGVRWAIRESAGGAGESTADRHLDVIAAEAARRRLDPDFVVTELGGLLGAFGHAVRAGRLPEAVDLGRAIAPGLVLAGMWDAWRSVVAGVRAAAEHLDRASDIAWAAHEQGTRALALGNRAEAEPLLLEALDRRRGLRQVEAAAYTLHNLRRLGIVGPVDTGGSGVGRWLRLGGGFLAVVLLLTVVGPTVAGIVFPPAASPSPSPSPTEEPTQAPPSTAPPTEVPPTIEPTLPPLVPSYDDGDYTYNEVSWAGSLRIKLAGGRGPYAFRLDDGQRSLENPATFAIEGKPCEPVTVSGTARSDDGQSVPLEFVMVPDPCATPIPIDLACVTFDTLAEGTPFGSKGREQPGDVFMETPEGITVAVIEYQPVEGPPVFDYALVRQADAYFGDGQWLDVAGVGLVFDFTRLPFAPAWVDFQFQDRNATENFAINGSDPYVGEIGEAPDPLGDVDLEFQMAYDDVGYKANRAILTGPVRQVTFGGDRDGIDTVCAHRSLPSPSPEPVGPTLIR